MQNANTVETPVSEPRKAEELLAEVERLVARSGQIRARQKVVADELKYLDPNRLNARGIDAATQARTLREEHEGLAREQQGIHFSVKRLAKAAAEALDRDWPHGSWFEDRDAARKGAEQLLASLAAMQARAERYAAAAAEFNSKVRTLGEKLGGSDLPSAPTVRFQIPGVAADHYRHHDLVGVLRDLIAKLQ